MTKQEFLKFILDDTLYEKGSNALQSKSNIFDTRVMQSLLNRIIDLGKPAPTTMIRIWSNSLYYGDEVRVYLPLTDITENTEWFSLANTLCQLICNENIWSKEKYIIEKDAVFAEGMSRSIRFEKRFDQMISQLIKDYSEDEKTIRDFSEKVYNLKNTVFRNQYGTTEINALIYMGILQLTPKEINTNLKLKRMYPEWKEYALEKNFYCIKDVFWEKEIAHTERYGFWMELEKVYCL